MPSIDTLLSRLPSAWGALAVLATAAVTGAAARSGIGHVLAAPARVDSLTVQVDSLVGQVDSLTVTVSGQGKQLDFLYCRELERAGETPPKPCLLYTR